MSVVTRVPHCIVRAVAGAAAAVGPSAMADVSYYEREFQPGSFTAIPVGEDSQVTATQYFDSGAPAPSLRVDLYSSNPFPGGLARCGVLITAAIYDPGTDGEIQSVHYTLDWALLYGQGQVGMAMLVQQSGVVYVSPAIVSSSFSFQTRDLDADAAHFFSVTDLVSHPDFSATAAPLQFGIYVECVALPPLDPVFYSAYDNIAMTVRTVPAASSGAAMLGLLSISGRVRRRRGAADSHRD